MDLIRLLLLQVESGERPVELSEYSEEEILYHCDLAIEAGLIKGRLVSGGSGDPRGARLQRLTWEGHEFLDAARDDTIWSTAKEKVAETGGAWTLDTLKALLIAAVKKTLLD